MADNITEVRLLAVPLENDYKHTLYFTSKSEQEEYFKSKTVDLRNNGEGYNYQRKDNVIRYPAVYDSIQTCNYVMYKNTKLSSKWYYAFITKMEYVNENRTDIYIETDVLQTWLFDYTVKPSFIEREHHNYDDWFNTVPENLETGEYITYNTTVDEALKEYVYLLQTTEQPNGDSPHWATNYGGIYGAGHAFIFTNITNLIAKLKEYEDKPEAIIGCYIIPTACLNSIGDDPNEKDSDVWDGSANWGGRSVPAIHKIEIQTVGTLGEYTPRNMKLLNFPYRYMLLSNNSGSSNVLHYERFTNNSNVKQFKVKGVPVTGGSIKCVPLDYKGVAENEEEGIMLGKYPTTSWSSDMYTAWLTQNAVNNGVGIASSALSIIGGTAMLFTGAGTATGVGMIAGGVLGIGNSLGSIYQHSFTPASAQGNTTGGDINTSAKTNTFYIYEMGITEEYARILDSYFDMFGYKVNICKEPNVNHRENYWFTKTIDANIDSNKIPANDMKKIKDCYNTGITFWKNPSNIGNYSVTNKAVYMGE